MDITNINYQFAMDYFKKPKRLACALGITPQAIYFWNEKVPELRKYEIAKLIEADWNNSEQALLFDKRVQQQAVA